MSLVKTKRKMSKTENRWGEKSPEVIRQEADQVVESAARLRAIADHMEAVGCPPVTVDGVRQIERAIADLDGYYASLEVALMKSGHKFKG